MQWLVVQPPPAGWQVFGPYVQTADQAGGQSAIQQAAQDHDVQGRLVAVPLNNVVKGDVTLDQPPPNATVTVVP